jgi:uncharacterized protein YqhQ
MKTSGIGGQAVLEGIMMRNKDKYAVAVRKPNKEIEVCVKEYKGVTKGNKILNLPFIRGVFNFIDSLILGMSTLMYSAEFYEDEDTEEVKKGDKIADSVFREKAESAIMFMTVIVAAILAVGLFVVLPSLASDFLKKEFHIVSYALVALIEGIIRVILFILYIFLISRMKDIQRTFMYHGAEHKCINCIEHGLELNVDNVLNSSRLHKRCGTSFLFLVMAISIVFFILIPVENSGMKIVVRIIMIPVIAGVSYEVLRFAGRHEGKFVDIVSAPGMALQKMTTKEPDREMAEVAIKAVEAVFDWKTFLAEYESGDGERL